MYINSIFIVIPGVPIPAARPRVTKWGTYNPKAKELRDISHIIKEQVDGKISIEPIALEISFFMPIPKGLSKKKHSELKGKPHAKRPDLDNLLKMSLDSMLNVLFVDDSQVYEITASKLYSETPRTEITMVEYKKL